MPWELLGPGPEVTGPCYLQSALENIRVSTWQLGPPFAGSCLIGVSDYLLTHPP